MPRCLLGHLALILVVIHTTILMLVPGDPSLSVMTVSYGHVLFNFMGNLNGSGDKLEGGERRDLGETENGGSGSWPSLSCLYLKILHFILNFSSIVNIFNLLESDGDGESVDNSHWAPHVSAAILIVAWIPVFITLFKLVNVAKNFVMVRRSWLLLHKLCCALTRSRIHNTLS